MSPYFPFPSSCKALCNFCFEKCYVIKFAFYLLHLRYAQKTPVYWFSKGLELWISADRSCVWRSGFIPHTQSQFFLSTMSFSLSRSIEDAYVDPAGDTKSFSQCPVHMCGKPQRWRVSQWSLKCYKWIKDGIPKEQGYCTESRGSCYDRHTCGSSSQLAVAVCRWGSGRSPQQWWFGKACSSGSQYTVHSTGACRHECCSSPGERVEWAPVTCSWPCTVLAVPTWVSLGQAGLYGKAALCKVESPFAACRKDSG